MRRTSRSAGDLKFGSVAPALPALPQPEQRGSRRASKRSDQPTFAEPGNQGEEDLGARFQSLGFLEVQRRSAKIADKLKVLLKGYQKPSLQIASQKLKAGQTAKIVFDSGDNLEQLLKAEELQRQSSWMPDLRRSVTIDDIAAAEINHERRGAEAVQLTSDLNPAFAEAMVRFGVLRNEVMDKAQDKKEKTERLLSQMTTQVQHGIKRRLRRTRTPQKLVKVEEEPSDSEPSVDLELMLSQQQREERLRRKQLKKSVAKFDKWMASYLEREGLKPPTRLNRPQTAPAMRTSGAARGIG